ncbi:hypothetical protein GUITHDRAFT_152434 [Guillardia theta CCMP2712]|uniref:Laminin EGF-like domain-containing protein n=1 Tax=Guillardia theta (strain CCMP2712) TaxID=905079 RepID=L1JD71_GUITC|nr:hypothetical protein GUITHDRAFT_152434 [Guillardia theta CCMP2712]EKX46247.1 hypothetical protein GUITHDRAFT_152434 [Guillardia theta CCMP2712]|eukprot:XP_005833227.1 hypothetical protein GUITHDRAFT_152434 [Guillardia theta CCMP2712]
MLAAAAVAVVALLGVATMGSRVSIELEANDWVGVGDKGITSQGWNGHITQTPSRVPNIPIFGMGYNDRLGVKPLCTHETDRRGLVDCIPRDSEDSWPVGTGNSYCNQVCIQCSSGMLSGQGCDNCYCGVGSSYTAWGTDPADCNQVCYFCRSAMLSGYECSQCSCGLWPAPLSSDPLDSWY